MKNTGKNHHRHARSVDRKWVSTGFVLLYILILSGLAFIWIRYQPIALDTFLGKLFLVLSFLFLPSLAKLILQLLSAPWYRLLLRRTIRQGGEGFRPSVSVIVPAWNEEVGVLSTVRSLLASTYRPLEVVVVNDGSTDGTDRVMRDFLAGEEMPVESGLSIRYIAKENGGKGSAINEGIRQSRSDIVMTIDADSVVNPETIEHMVAPFCDDRVMSVAGNVRIGNRSKLIGLFQQMEYLYGFYFKQADSILESVYIVGGAAAAYRRSIFGMIGLFDEKNITEDIEFSTRVQAAGFRIWYAPQALVYTEGPSDIVGLCKQRLRWKYGRFLTFWKYRRLFFSLRRGHGQFLMWVTLPVALLSELTLFLQWPLLPFVFPYAFLSGNIAFLLYYNAVISLIVLFQILTDVRFRDNRNLLFLVPISWIVFLIIDLVEYQALLRSSIRFARGTGVSWQRWKRVGVFGETSSSSESAVA